MHSQDINNTLQEWCQAVSTTFVTRPRPFEQDQDQDFEILLEQDQDQSWNQSQDHDQDLIFTIPIKSRRWHVIVEVILLANADHFLGAVI